MTEEMKQEDHYEVYLESYSNFVDDSQFVTIKDNILWATIALGSEVGEFQQMVEKALRKGKTFSKDEINSELGDIMWNVANLARLHGISLVEMLEFNVDKLSERKKEAAESTENRAAEVQSPNQ